MLDPSHVLPGMVAASYRGVPFFAPDTATEVGRRVAEHLFPGIDVASYDDHGLLPDIISLQGILIGDDYVAQAKALKAAFKKAGPATLVHPWEGPMTVIMVDTAEITFDSKELRVARFVASFRRTTAAGKRRAGISTSSGLLSAASALSKAAGVLSGSTLQTALSAVRSKGLARGFRVLSGVWNGLAGAGTLAGLAGSVITPLIGGRVASLLTSALPLIPPINAAGFQAIATGITDTLINLVPALADEPAIAPAADAPAPVIGITPVLASHVALAAGNRLVEQSAEAPSPTDRAFLIAAAGEAYSAAAQISIAIEHPSRKEAQAFRQVFTDALDSYAEAIEPLTDSATGQTTYSMPASALARAVSDLKVAAITDINEAIGRLPDVLVFNPDRDIDAAQIAQHVYGDTPDQLEAGHRAIVSRNRPKHPAQLQAGPIEVLKPEGL